MYIQASMPNTKLYTTKPNELHQQHCNNNVSKGTVKLYSIPNVNLLSVYTTTDHFSQSLPEWMYIHIQQAKYHMHDTNALGIIHDIYYRDNVVESYQSDSSCLTYI